jgi:hypothetical protein
MIPGMYDVPEVLNRIDTNVGVVVALLALGWIGGFVQIVEALRLGFREKVAGQPVGTTVVMLAHDATFAAGFTHWFQEIDHICFKLFWVGMVVSVLIELVLLWHWVRFRGAFSRDRLPTPLVCAILGAFLVFAFALWWWVRSLVDDPLDLVGLTLVQVGAVVFGLPMLLGRGSARGSSRVFAWATVLGPGSLGFLFIPYLAPAAFDRWPFWTLVAAVFSCAVAFLLTYEHFRRADAPRPVATEPAAVPA